MIITVLLVSTVDHTHRLGYQSVYDYDLSLGYQSVYGHDLSLTPKYITTWISGWGKELTIRQRIRLSWMGMALSKADQQPNEDQKSHQSPAQRSHSGSNSSMDRTPAWRSGRHPTASPVWHQTDQYPAHSGAKHRPPRANQETLDYGYTIITCWPSQICTVVKRRPSYSQQWSEVNRNYLMSMASTGQHHLAVVSHSHSHSVSASNCDQ